MPAFGQISLLYGKVTTEAKGRRISGRHTSSNDRRETKKASKKLFCKGVLTNDIILKNGVSV